MQIPKNIKFSEIKENSFRISWNIDDIKLLNFDKNQIKYKVEMRKEKQIFISSYEGKDKNCTINNLDKNTNYEIRICSIYNNNKSNYTQIYKIKTDY